VSRGVQIPAEVGQALRDGATLVVSISGGKDSQAMLQALVAEHGARSEWTGPIVAVHADLGRAEWHQTPAIVEAQAAAAGVELHVVQRAKGDLLQRLEAREEQVRGQDKPFWPSSAARYCTSDLKRDPIDKFLRTFDHVVCAVGIRRQESTGRASKPCWETRKRIVTQSRRALTWHPIIEWSEAEIWEALGGRHGDLVHPAYALGNDRLSCSLCVLASRADLERGAKHNPEYHQALIQLERRSGFTFTATLSVEELGK
jgi:3'-phosphoadenosine 5'-phosphosulfate sulfotransferase (PAPS reductase)/FAD synthetase